MNTIYFLVKSRAVHRDDIGLEPPDQKADSIKHAEAIVEQRRLLEDLVPMHHYVEMRTCEDMSYFVRIHKEHPVYKVSWTPSFIPSNYIVEYYDNWDTVSDRALELLSHGYNTDFWEWKIAENGSGKWVRQ